MKTTFHPSTRLSLPVAALAAVAFGLAGCGSPRSPGIKTDRPQLPPTALGALTTPAGSASAEVTLPADMAFDITENLLRKNYRITFINHNLRRLEAETKTLRGPSNRCVTARKTQQPERLFRLLLLLGGHRKG